MSKPFRYYLRVRYGECDAQRVVFNARYAEYCDIATTEFLRAAGFGEALLSGELDFQLVKQTMEWKAPVRFDQVLEISVFATHLGNTSFTIATEFRIAREERVIVQGATVHVLVDSKTLHKMQLTADFRAVLERGVPNAVTDHAGFFARL